MNEIGIKFIIAVTFNKCAVLVSCPKEYLNLMDGFECDENGFDDLPDQPGVYECTVDFWQEEDDGEADWGFKVKDTRQFIRFGMDVGINQEVTT